MRFSDIPYVVEPMRLEDLEEVLAIERMAFPLPWSLRAYRWELTNNHNACYLVARQRQPKQGALKTTVRSPVLAYGGFWLVIDEAHISTLAVHPDWRRHGLGSLIMAALLDKAVERGAVVATLEVRVSNEAAQNLYRTFGFERVGLRRHYYQDNNEDALIMTTPLLTTASFQRRLTYLKEMLIKRLVAPVDKTTEVEYNLH
ncbi:MAG: ribosomal protein S18-alanine N-acetyltransferase [Anaerolineae bacterium]|jgi:ribosomal-protein-alanine N-acetyltransferase|nr:ribosomal protein S18-alanine N-acetyltransferase [Anaerolineae bacterium]MDH7474761.1 ribosomal protein S18-alanine N-acetyltransferase [Anaerolineae bacterium]